MSENLSQKAYWHIHDKLTTGTLKPGFRLSNRAVAREVGISFTPVREALNRLVSEGLLEYREGLGVFVPQASRREIEELYEVREMLECAVVVRACGRLPGATLGEMRHLQDQMQIIVDLVDGTGRIAEHGERFRELDSAFHLTLIRGTGNRQLLETVTDLRKKCAIKSGGESGMAALIGHVFQTEPIESVQRTCRDHDHLLELLKDSSGEEEAGLLMGRHIRNGRQLALAAMERTYMSVTRRVTQPSYSATETSDA
ncbi:MAG TPA: GntR family transcriptional regulator [Thermoguttaceae bacterium]|nr:GntR family transcriptional regulator [Thermoguttaceae bacterium]